MIECANPDLTGVSPHERSESKAAPNQGRREFLKAGGAVTAALLAPSALADTPKTMPALPANPRTTAAMPTRNLGKTGYKVGIFSLGGQASLEKPNNFDVAVPIIEARPRPGRKLSSTRLRSTAARNAGASSMWARSWPTAATKHSSLPRPRSAPATAPCA